MIAFKGGSRSAGGSRSGMGKSFGGLVAYLQHGHRQSLNPERVEWTSTRNLDDIEDPRSAAKVMRAHAEQNPRVARPVYHFGLSLAEGEHLTQAQWNAAVDRVLDRMGLAGHQAVVIAHGDTSNEHVHVVVNRVGEDFRAWNARRDMVKANEVVHELENEHQLRRTGGREHPLPKLTGHQYQEARRTHQQPLADQVREQAGLVLARATSWQELEEQLAAHGWRLEPGRRGSGVVVTDGDRRASLSHVDRTLSGPQLAQRFGETFREYRGHCAAPPSLTPHSTSTVPPPGSDLEGRAAALVARVSETRATFTRADLQRAAFYQPDRAALVDRALKSERVIDLGRDACGARRFTTREYLEAESRLFFSANGLAGSANLRLETAAVERSLEGSRQQLSEEQRAAVFHATTQSDLAQIVGRAGAGKTTTAQAIAAAYRDQGYEVYGAALAGKAAEGLQREAGIPSRTLASLEQAWAEKRDRLHDRAVLVIDEAGIVDARQLGRVLIQANLERAKVVLLGDPGQLKAIGAGDAYRGLLERHPSAHLDTIRRQGEPWQRAASQALANGRVSPALDSYERAGRLHWTEHRAEARAELVARFLKDRTERPEDSQLILAYRNADVAMLNEAVRAERKTAGDLRGGVTVQGAEYAAGDRVVFLRNDHSGREVTNLDAGASAAGVRNGTLGTVEQATEHRFTVRLDDGRRVGFDPEQYKALAHGYAVTLHKSQGATVDQVYVLADSMMNRNAAYVALTRHREGVHLYADRETFGGRIQLDRVLSRESRKDLARDYAAADLQRLADRVTVWQGRAAAIQQKLAPLLDSRYALRQADEARGRLETHRAEVQRAALAVYANPREATRALLADPKAAERLAAGEAAAYGTLRGRARVILGPDAERKGSEQSLPPLTWAVRDHHRAMPILARQIEIAAKIPHGIEELSRRIDALSRGLQQARAATRSPEKALEIAARKLGYRTVRAALELLPGSAYAPVLSAVRAVERALSLGRGFGR